MQWMDGPHISTRGWAFLVRTSVSTKMLPRLLAPRHGDLCTSTNLRHSQWAAVAVGHQNYIFQLAFMCYRIPVYHFVTPCYRLRHNPSQQRKTIFEPTNYRNQRRRPPARETRAETQTEGLNPIANVDESKFFCRVQSAQKNKGRLHVEVQQM